MTRNPPNHGINARQRARIRASARPRLLVFALLTLLLSSCTLYSNKHMEIDFMGVKYRFYIYEKPSAQLSVDLRGFCISTAGSSRREWAGCSLKYLRQNVDAPSIPGDDWDVFMGSDQWDDYGGAVDAIVDGGFGMDASKQRYAKNCLVGDHTGFRSYNWTTREANDSHCERGENVR